MLKYFVLFFLTSFQTIAQINSTEIVCDNSESHYSLNIYKDKNGNEYFLYGSDLEDSTFIVKLQKWDKNDTKVFPGCGINIFSFSRSILNDSTGKNKFINIISTNIQVDDSSNILVVFNINTSDLNKDSLFTLSDIYAFKFDSLGNSKWDSNGIKIVSNLKNGTVENFEILKNGSSHLLLTSSLVYPNSVSESKYISINNDGNKVFENNQDFIDEWSYKLSSSFLRNYYLFKIDNKIFVSSFIYNSPTEFTVRTRKFSDTGTFEESSIDIITDEFALNRIDILGDNVLLISQNDSKGEIRKFSFLNGFENTPTFILENMPVETFINNQYLIYGFGDSTSMFNRIQMVDSLGTKFFGASGISVKENLAANFLAFLSFGNDFLIFPDSSIGYLQIHNTIPGTSAGYITYLKITNKNMIHHPELRVNNYCVEEDETLIKAYIDTKDNSINLYYYLLNGPIVRQNFYSFPKPMIPSICPPISTRIIRN